MTRSHLVLDIETILDPELPAEPSADQKSLPVAPHHKIVALGVLLLVDYTVAKIGLIGNDDEAEMLASFSRYLERENPPTIVTFSGRGFDMPVIAMRCMRHGVPLRHYYQGRDVRYRYSDQGHLDLADHVSDFGAARTPKLDALARLCGMPGKVGVDGSQVAQLIQDGKLEDVRSYCLCDVAQTAGAFLRFELLRGEISRETYIGGMRSLIAKIREDERLAPVSAGLDVGRLLLGEPEKVERNEQPKEAASHEEPGANCAQT